MTVNLHCHSTYCTYSLSNPSSASVSYGQWLTSWTPGLYTTYIQPPPISCRMVPLLCPAVTKVGCLKHLAQQQACCQHVAPGDQPTAAGRVEPASIGNILDRIMHIVVVTTNQHQMVRCVGIVCDCTTVELQLSGQCGTKGCP